MHFPTSDWEDGPATAVGANVTMAGRQWAKAPFRAWTLGSHWQLHLWKLILNDHLQ
jgi:hypothetical protein